MCAHCTTDQGESQYFCADQSGSGRRGLLSILCRQTTASAEEEERNEESLFSIPAAFLLLLSRLPGSLGGGRGGPGERGGGKLINKEKKGRRKFPVYGARSPREEEERMKKKERVSKSSSLPLDPPSSLSLHLRISQQTPRGNGKRMYAKANEKGKLNLRKVQTGEMLILETKCLEWPLCLSFFDSNCYSF